MGGRAYTYNYDWGGRLTSQYSNAGQNIQYAYYANGYIREAKDFAERTVSRYGYDNAGNRIWEAYSQLNANDELGANYQSLEIKYDELNRISRVEDDTQQLDVQYEYDAVGNRRAVHAVYWDPATLGTRREDHLWYKYDLMNRFVLTMGTLSGARGISRADSTSSIVVGTDGVLIGYDAASQRVSAESLKGGKETYQYSNDGYLEDTRSGDGSLIARRRVDALGRTIQYIEGGQATNSVYDRDNRLLEESNEKGVTNFFYANDAADTDALASRTGAGSLLRTEFRPAGKSETTKTWYTYQYWDEAKQSTIKLQAFNETSPKSAPGISRLTYTVNGFLKSAFDDGAQLETQYFTSAHGQVLRRNRLQNGRAVGTQYFYYVDGRRIGDVTDTPGDHNRVSYAEALAIKDKSVDRRTLYKNFKPVTSSDFDQNYEPISESYPAAVGATYTVRGGETLQTIARVVWGDAAMWYLLAEANGLAGTETLTAGQVLLVPNKVTNIHNNADTFRPYSPGEAIGRIDPTLPAPKLKKGCGGLGQIVGIVVTVVLMAYGYYYTAPIAGNAAGQATNIATGSQQGFNWGSFAMSAVSAGVGAGVAQYAGAIGMGGGSTWAVMGRAALASTITQGVGVATGLQSRFSWQGVAASAAGAGVANIVQDSLVGNSYTELRADGQLAQVAADPTFGHGLAGSIARGFVSGMAGTAVAQLAGAGRVDARSVFFNTLGNALGSSLAAASSGDAFGMTAGEAEERAAAREVFAGTQRDAVYGLASASNAPYARLGEPSGAGVAEWSNGVDRAISRSAAEQADIEQRLADLAPPPLGSAPGILLADSSGNSPFTPGSSMDGLRQGWNREGWSVLQGPKPFTYGFAESSRNLWGAMTGADSSNASREALKNDKYGVAAVEAAKSVLEAGATVLTLGASSSLNGLRVGGVTASELAAVRATNFGSTRTATLGEPGAVTDLLYGARPGEGLPGSAGVAIPARPTPVELANLSEKHSVEFAATYRYGPGRNGGGGQYYLYSGERAAVEVPISADEMLIYHTHPGGTSFASQADMDVLDLLKLAGSPQRSSQIVPVGKDVVRCGPKGWGY
jgi:hypothetical protein